MPCPFALQTARAEDFTPHIGSGFALALEEGGAPACALMLTEVAAGQDVAAGRPPFSLLLEGASVPTLSQGTYFLTHPKMVEFALFLVPIGTRADRRIYQAIFN